MSLHDDRPHGCATARAPRPTGSRSTSTGGPDDLRASSTRAPTSSQRAFATASVVSTLTGNSVEHVALLFACAKAGAILHPISWRLAPAEVAYQLDDAEPGRSSSSRTSTATSPRQRWRSPSVRACADARSARRANAGRQPCGRRRAAPHLHVRHDREAEGRAADARELLLDEPLVRPRDRHRRRRRRPRRCCRSSTCGGWNVQPLLAWWKGARVVLERGLRRRARALRPGRGAAGDDDDGRAGELPLHGAGAAASPPPTSRRFAARSSAVRRCRCRCSRRGASAGSRSSRATV